MITITIIVVLMLEKVMDRNAGPGHIPLTTHLIAAGYLEWIRTLKGGRVRYGTVGR